MSVCKSVIPLSFLLSALSPVAATAADLSFCWTGANGYTMTGKMRVAPDAMDGGIVTENDLTAFKIAGYRDGKLLGTWDMTQRDPQTTWHLRFDSDTMTFLTGGSFQSLHSQGWNANGNVSDCGTPGFGFNSGNYAQDICVNGRYLSDSSIDPTTPLRAGTGPVSPTCGSTMLMSKSQDD